MTYWWVSWYSGKPEGGFEIHSPWWISGCRMSDDKDTIVAAVEACLVDSPERVWDYIKGCYDTPPEYLEERFCEIKEGSPFSDRFPRADWMRWSE